MVHGFQWSRWTARSTAAPRASAQARARGLDSSSALARRTANELCKSRAASTPISTARRQGDRIRLADTELIIEIEKDFTHYGDEITFGGGKVIRDGMGQSSGALRETLQHGALDLVITNAVILDHWGIVKARHRHQERPHRQSGQSG